MNKGIIMEVKKNYAIALNNSGVMEKISSKQDMKVGQKIFYFEEDIIKSINRTNMHNSFIKTFGTIAALFLLVFTFFQSMGYEKAYAVVSLDINPSIQIEASSDKKIVKIEGMNDDGKNIDFEDVTGSDINEGIEKIKQILVEKKYLDSNKEVLVAFALIKDQDDSQYEESVKDAIQSTFKTENITYVKGNKDAVDEAKTQGISLGRYEASLTVNEEIKKNIEKVPVKEITSSIKDKENVIHWEAQDEQPKDENTSKTDGKNQQTIDKPAVDKPAVDKPANTIPSDVAKPDKDTVVSTPNKNKNTEDNGVLEVAPEIQQPPKESIEVPKESENDATIISPDNGTLENNQTSGKIEDKENTESIQKENKNEINK